MKKLTVKISKQTGYKYLEADKVKKLTDDLIDALAAEQKKRDIQHEQNNLDLKHLFNDVFEHEKDILTEQKEREKLEKAYKGHITWHKLQTTLDNAFTPPENEFCTCKEPSLGCMANFCIECQKPIRPLHTQGEILPKGKHILMDEYSFVEDAKKITDWNTQEELREQIIDLIWEHDRNPIDLGRKLLADKIIALCGGTHE